MAGATANPVDLERINRRLRAMESEIGGKGMQERLRGLGRAAQVEAAKAVRSTPSKTAGRTLSDGSMSGWHRGKPVELATRVTIHRTPGTPSVLVTPDRTAGLWRVLESGRAAQTKGDRVARGVTKAGNVRRRRVRRTMGATEGKQTWTRAQQMMSAVLGKAQQIETLKAVQRIWR